MLGFGQAGFRLVTLAPCLNSSVTNRDEAGLDGKFGARREPVHLTPQVSVIYLGCLEELHVTVRGARSARVADGLHFGGTERLKAAGDLDVLVQHAQGIDAAYGD